MNIVQELKGGSPTANLVIGKHPATCLAIVAGAAAVSTQPELVVLVPALF
jgi:hypothetical protein